MARHISEERACESMTWRVCSSASSACAPVVLLLLEARQDQQGQQGQEAPVDRAGLPRREDLAGREGPVAQRVLAPPALALSTMPAELPIRGQRPSMLGAKLTPSWRRLPAGTAFF
jgi:hypothetical protein